MILLTISTPLDNNNKMALQVDDSKVAEVYPNHVERFGPEDDLSLDDLEDDDDDEEEGDLDIEE